MADVEGRRTPSGVVRSSYFASKLPTRQISTLDCSSTEASAAVSESAPSSSAWLDAGSTSPPNPTKSHFFGDGTSTGRRHLGSTEAGQLAALFSAKRGVQCAVCLAGAGADGHGVGRLPRCGHQFCLGCITEWAAVSGSCPLCKSAFEAVHRLRTIGGSVQGTVPRPDKRLRLHDVDDSAGGGAVDFLDHDGGELDEIKCQACGSDGHEDQLLMCDTAGCSQAFHTWCLRPPLPAVPPDDTDWYCPGCVPTERRRYRRGSRPRLMRTDVLTREKAVGVRGADDDDDDTDTDTDTDIVFAAMMSAARSHPPQSIVQSDSGSGDQQDEYQFDGFVVPDEPDPT